MIKKLLPLLASAFLIQIASAADSDPVPISLPENFACTVKVDHPAGPVDHAPKQIDIVRFQGTRQDKTTLVEGGPILEVWWFEKADVTLYETPTSGGVYILKGEYGDRMRPALLRFSPSTIAWIKPENFKENGDYHGQKCSHYHGPGPGMTLDLVPKPIPADAWIDMKTGLPVAFSDPEWTYTLTFTDPPTGLPKIPPDIAKELKRQQTQ